MVSFCPSGILNDTSFFSPLSFKTPNIILSPSNFISGEGVCWYTIFFPLVFLFCNFCAAIFDSWKETYGVLLPGNLEVRNLLGE